jgi:hypothetical protein
MAQRDNLVYQGAHAYGIEERAECLARLEAWLKARTCADWRAMTVAEYGAGKPGRRRLMAECEDMSPIGQRR